MRPSREVPKEGKEQPGQDWGDVLICRKRQTMGSTVETHEKVGFILLQRSSSKGPRALGKSSD